MSNFLARCAAIGLVGGGFAATGDLGWLAARGMQLVNARTVPSEQAVADAVAAPPQPLPGPAAPGLPAADPFRSQPASPPAARDPADTMPPLGGPERVDLSALRAGERVTAWIGRSPAAGPPGCITFDLVGPATGEALLLGRGLAPRRVTIRPSGSPRPIISRGDTLVIAPVGSARHAAAAAEACGPVTAIAVGR